MKIKNIKLIFIVSLVLQGLNGCSINKQDGKSGSVKQSSDNKVSVLDLNDIKPLDTILSNLQKHRTVFVGESHTNYAHHLNQLAVIKSVHKQAGKNTSIGLEMVQQPYQLFLDDYIASKISERAMLGGVEWYDRWKYDFRLYRPIFEYAKQNKIPLVALNIPKELTKRISKIGIKGLTSSERKQLPKVLDKSNPAYNARLEKVFSMHSRTSSKGFDKFFESQLAWDEGMAFAAAKYLKKNPSKRMVILAGGGHIINREGIPSRLDRQLGTRSVVILNNVDEKPSTVQGDYLLFSSNISLPPAGFIGITMAETKIGVKVMSITPKGAAFKAGLKKGDIILALDKQLIKVRSDVGLWKLDKKPNDLVSIKVRRNNKVLLKQMKLGDGKKAHGMMGLGKIHKK